MKWEKWEKMDGSEGEASHERLIIWWELEFGFIIIEWWYILPHILSMGPGAMGLIRDSNIIKYGEL